uniref:hypothetical protein n=1 Tax=Parabacteroides goldsteinii TaxID=328812 RepID=UPI0026DAF01E
SQEGSQVQPVAINKHSYLINSEPANTSNITEISIDLKTFIIFMNNRLRLVVFIEKGFTILNRYAYG